ncbi:transposase [Clostridium sp. BJN0013]|uniref:transposase n=1 Tax=Clostridium sp. BJN0013 TaxID=3236840 RepID=UPI0034C62B23
MPFIDSTALDVCNNRRIYLHKVFKEIAKLGRSSTGWFYGFKLHLVVNDVREKFFLFI